MALILSDGFSLYNTSADASKFKGWTVTGSSGITYQSAGRWGTGSYAMILASTGPTNGYFTQTLSLSGSTSIVGMAIKVGSTPTSGGRLMTITNGSASLAITWATGNKLAVTDNASTTYFTLSSGLGTGTWYYIELKVLWNASTGRVIFRTDGSTQYDSGATMNLGSSTNATSLTIGASTSATLNTSYTDLVIMDGSGGSFNDTLGDIRIETLLPTGDGSNSGWGLPNDTIVANANQSRMTTNISGWTNLSGSTLSRVSSGGPDASTFPTYGHVTGSGGFSFISSPNGTSGWPVTPGQVLGVGLWRKSNILSASGLTMSLRFYDSGGAQVGSDLSFGAVVSPASWSFVTPGVGVTVPASAATCALICAISSGLTSFDFTGVTVSTTSIAPNFADPAGAHWLETGDSSSYDNLTYVQSNTAGVKDSYVMSDLQSTAGNVLAVRTMAVARKESASTRTMATITRVNGTDYLGTTSAPPNDLSYQVITDTYLTSPDTGIAWTRSEVNNMETGVDLIS